MRHLLPAAWFSILLLASLASAQVIVRPLEATGNPKDSDIVIVHFLTGGHCDKAAKGLAVVDAQGQGVPFRVLMHEPEGRTCLAIQARAATGLTVQYSPAPHPASKRDDKLPVSLFVQTFGVSKKGVKDAGELSKLLAGAPPRGTMLMPHISLAYDPWGGPDNFSTLFEGLLTFDTKTTLRLFSSHHAAAFVEIDGKVVIAGDKPNLQHDSEKLDAGATEVTLDKGVHKVRYLHTQTEGRSMALLGYIDGKRALPLPASMFVHDREGRLGDGRMETGKGAAAPGNPVGFDASQVDQIGYDQWVYLRWRFRPIAPAPGSAGSQYHWDFGDGVGLTMPADGKDRAIEHVYAVVAEAPRTWKVKLELVDKAGHAAPGEQATSSILAAALDNLGIEDHQRLATYAGIINRADYSKAGSEVMANLYELLAVTETPQLIVPLAEQCLKRYGDKGGPAIWGMKSYQAQWLARDDPEAAAKLYRSLANGAPDSWKGACAAAEYLDLLIYRLNKSDVAQREVIALSANRAAKERALLQVRAGDIARLEGDMDKAADTYRRAQQATFREIDGKQAAVLQRAHREMALSCLNQKRYPAVRDELLQWEAEFPLAKLGSELPVLIGRYFQEIGDDPRAVIEFDSLLKLNPLHPNRPEVAFRLGQSLWKTGKKDEARKWFAEVATKYPNSPFAAEVGRYR